jgi:hypothetical protein
MAADNGMGMDATPSQLAAPEAAAGRVITTHAL